MRIAISLIQMKTVTFSPSTGRVHGRRRHGLTSLLLLLLLLLIYAEEPFLRGDDMRTGGFFRRRRHFDPIVLSLFNRNSVSLSVLKLTPEAVVTIQANGHHFAIFQHDDAFSRLVLS